MPATLIIDKRKRLDQIVYLVDFANKLSVILTFALKINSISTVPHWRLTYPPVARRRAAENLSPVQLMDNDRLPIAGPGPVTAL